MCGLFHWQPTTQILPRVPLPEKHELWGLLRVCMGICPDEKRSHGSSARYSDVAALRVVPTSDDDGHVPLIMLWPCIGFAPEAMS